MFEAEACSHNHVHPASFFRWVAWKLDVLPYQDASLNMSAVPVVTCPESAWDLMDGLGTVGQGMEVTAFRQKVPAPRLSSLGCPTRFPTAANVCSIWFWYG